MTLNHDEFLEYIITHGITLARTSKNFYNIPKNTKLYFGFYSHPDFKSITTYNRCVEYKNKKLNYKFDYDYSNYWKKQYNGTFEIECDHVWKQHNNNFQNCIKCGDMRFVKEECNHKWQPRLDFLEQQCMKCGQIKGVTEDLKPGQIVIDEHTSFNIDKVMKKLENFEVPKLERLDKFYGISIAEAEGYAYRSIVDQLAIEQFKANKDSNKNNQLKRNFMSKALRFIRNAALKPDERLLRKYNMKNEDGCFTGDCYDVIRSLEAKRLGYKSEVGMANKLGFTNSSISIFEFHAMLKLHLPAVLENLKALQKEEGNKK